MTRERMPLLLLLLLTGLLAAGCSGDPETNVTDTGIQPDADVSSSDFGPDAQQDAGNVDTGTDLSNNQDAGDDTGLPDNVLLVEVPQAGSDVDIQVVLGRGDDVRVQPLDAQGEARFVDPGPGPYTVTLLEPQRRAALTWAQAPGPVVTFESPPFGGDLVTVPAGNTHPVRVFGDVSGTAPGNDVTVELLMNGEVYDRAVGVSGSYDIDATSFGIDAGSKLHIAVVERNGTTPVRMGIYEVTDDLQAAIDRQVDVSPDVTIDHDLNVTATNVTASEPLYANAAIALGDGAFYAPFFGTELQSGKGTLQLATLSGSLQNYEMRLKVETLNSSIVLQAHQMGVETLTTPLPSDITVELLAQPEFITATGEDEPVEHAATDFSLDFTGSQGSTEPLWLFIRGSGDSCQGDFAWIVTLPPSAESFTPFELRADLEFASIPSNVALELSLFLANTDGTRRSGTAGSIRLTEEVTCAEEVPEWLAGEFAGIGPEGQAPFVDDHRLEVEPCGSFRYEIEGGDFSGSFCGDVIMSGQDIFLRADDTFSFLFNGETEADVEMRSPAYHGVDGILLTARSTQDTAIFVKRPSPQPASLANLLPGMYDGVSVTYSLHANNQGIPGAELNSQGPFPADGTVQGIGDYQVEITAGGDYLERQFFPLAILFRDGIVSAFDGTNGTVVMTNGPGIASDLDAELDLVRAVDGTVTVVSTKEVVDVNDVDADGDTTDSLFESFELELTPSTQ